MDYQSILNRAEEAKEAANETEQCLVKMLIESRAMSKEINALVTRAYAQARKATQETQLLEQELLDLEQAENSKQRSET